MSQYTNGQLNRTVLVDADDPQTAYGTSNALPVTFGSADLATETTLSNIDGKINVDNSEDIANNTAIDVMLYARHTSSHVTDIGTLKIDGGHNLLVTDANVDSLNNKVSNGQQTMANSIAVAIASDQDVLASESTLNSIDTKITACDTTNLATSANQIRTSSVYRNINVNATGSVIKASAGQLVSMYFLNWSGVPSFVKIYDQATAPTSSDTPVMNISLYNYQNANMTIPIPVAFSNGISIRATTGAADNANVSPTANSVSCSIVYI